MSDYIPFEIQVEIIKHLPIKPLLQFRSVSKAWKSLIDSSDFITHYHTHHLQQQHLLVGVGQAPKYEYISIADDHTFPHHKVPVVIPKLVNMLRSHTRVGNSHGLFCLYGYGLKGTDCDDTIDMAVIWNPSIRKAVAVIVSKTLDTEFVGFYLGFGVCRETSDPKIIKIIHVRTWINGGLENLLRSIDGIICQVEVFTLSTGVWRIPYSNLPRESIEFHKSQVALDGVLYWLAIDWIAVNGSKRNLIVSFDVTNEEFREIDLPDSLAIANMDTLFLFKLRESLVVVEHGLEATILWMMEDAVPSLFTKLFTVDLYAGLKALVIGFRKTGQPIIGVLDEDGLEDDYHGLLAVYEPNSKLVDYLGIDGKDFSVLVDSYMETLLLLNHPDLTVYKDMEDILLEDVLFEGLTFI